MAKHTSSKKKPTPAGNSQPAATPQLPPTSPDLATIFEELDDWKFRQRTIHSHQLRERVAEVSELRGKLAIAEARLEHEFGPLIALYHGFTPAAIAARKASQFYDEPLRKLCTRIKLKDTRSNTGNGSGRKLVATGAKPWDELQTQGATDEQIWKNLQSVPEVHWQKRVEHEWVFETCVSSGNGRADEEHNGLLWRPVRGSEETVAVVRGKSKLIAEVRRVLEIGLPPKAATAKSSTAKKKTTKTKTAARPKKSAVRAKSPKAKKSNKPAAEKPAAKSAARAAKKPTVSGYAVTEVKFSNASAAASSPRPSTLDTQPTTAERLAAAGIVKAKPDAIDVVRARPGATTSQVAAELGVATDVAGSRLRRLAKKDLVRIDDGAWFAVEKGQAARGQASGKDPHAAADAALNDVFETSLRDRGKKRNDALKQIGRATIDDDTAGLESLKREREWSDKLNGNATAVVVDRRKTSPAAGAPAKPK